MVPNLHIGKTRYLARDTWEGGKVDFWVLVQELRSMTILIESFNLEVGMSLTLG
jgi:hypothetical protein